MTDERDLTSDAITQPSQPSPSQPLLYQLDQYALPAVAWWIGGVIALGLVTLIIPSTLALIIVWAVVGMVAALVTLFVLALRAIMLIDEHLDAYQSLVNTSQPQLASEQPSREQPSPPQSSHPQSSQTVVFDRDGVAIQFAEIFKELP